MPKILDPNHWSVIFDIEDSHLFIQDLLEEIAQLDKADLTALKQTISDWKATAEVLEHVGGYEEWESLHGKNPKDFIEVFRPE
jgi:hypothetical protein